MEEEEELVVEEVENERGQVNIFVFGPQEITDKQELTQC